MLCINDNQKLSEQLFWQHIAMSSCEINQRFSSYILMQIVLFFS